MKILIIGYGSIGKRHDEVLKTFHNIKKIDIVTKQKLDNKTTFTSLDNVKNINKYDYFIIASQTNKHYEQLKYLENKLNNKLIFCEKPLFETNKELNIHKNNVYIGYVLRFHPLLDKLKKLLKNEKILTANISCGQYLPTWRPNADYKECYSAKKSQGGGVLLDLSHEIDYAQWLCGKIIDIKSYQTHISDLRIDSDDIMTLIGKTQKGVIVNISIDYISKIANRRLLINTVENTYDLDLIANTLACKNKIGLEERYDIANLERNYMFEQMHRSILTNKKNSCNYEDGLKTMEVISVIQEQNK